MGTSVYTVANDRFFVGLLGLLGSLRAHGHRGPVVVVDSGLTARQRSLVHDQVTFVPAPRDAPSHYLKAVGPLTLPDDIMVFADSDMLCVRPLDDIVDKVARGSIVAFEDVGRAGFSDALWTVWDERLRLGGLEPRPYVNGGFLAAPRDAGGAFFRAFGAAIEQVEPAETYIHDAAGIDVSLPFVYACQDVINALLASSAFRADVETLPYAYAPHPPFTGLRVTGPLACADAAGRAPFFLHHVLQKPWLEPLPPNLYAALLVEAIHHPLAPDIPDRELPRFLRSGPSGATTRAARAVRGRIRVRVRGRLGLRPRLVRAANNLRHPRSV